MKFNDASIVSVKRNDYRIHFCYMSKGDDINVMKNSDLNKKVAYYEFFYCINIRKNEYLLSKEQRKTIKSSKRIL